MFTSPSNQRKAVSAARVSFVARVALLTTLIGATALAYVWQKNKIYQLGNEIRKNEQELDALRKKQAVLDVQLAQLKSPRALWEKCQSWKIGLAAPRGAQVVRLAEPSNHFAPPPVTVAEAPAPVAPPKRVARNSTPPPPRGG